MTPPPRGAGLFVAVLVVHAMAQLAAGYYRRRRGEPADWEAVCWWLAVYPLVFVVVGLVLDAVLPPGWP